MEMDGLWYGEPVTCMAGRARDRKRRQFERDGGDTAGVMFAPKRRDQTQ